jgi:hypothetical protein
MSERFISPCQPPEGLERELLECIIEEAAEVQQRVTKALRFGLPEVQPGQPHNNACRIGLEIGDLWEVINMACERGIIPRSAIVDGGVAKREKLRRYLQNQSATVTS